jgi:hypothetical protein
MMYIPSDLFHGSRVAPPAPGGGDSLGAFSFNPVYYTAPKMSDDDDNDGKEMRDILECVICGKHLEYPREHVDTCGQRCFRALLRRQREQQSPQ